LSSEERNDREHEKKPDPQGDPPEDRAEEPRASDEPPAGETPEPADDLEALAEEVGEPEIEEVVDAEAEGLRAELEATRRERDEYLDALRRLKAEFENSRKRQEREKERLLQTASERLISELLPVLDNLDRALETEGDVREGVRATRDQLVATLGREGLSPVASDGQPFDPNVHEAVMGQPSDEHEEGTILQTFERGYVLNGKAIRPAKVVVARRD
jgi:molecular chaperone GrpE